MKRFTLPLLFVLLVTLVASCAGLKGLLSQGDAAAALRQMLSIGVREGLSQQFTKDAVLAALLPEAARKAVRTIETLGLSPELERVTNTLGTVAQSAATTSIPVFENAISRIQFTDALQLVKAGGTSATDYLRSQSGDSLRRALKPIMQAAIDEHKLADDWAKVSKPLQSVSGNRINPDLATLMAGMVTESMFRQIAEKETDIRTNTAARTTPLLRQAFGR